MTDLPELPPEIDTAKPHPARIYDYSLGGKNHFAAGRAVADQVLESWPGARTGAGAGPRPKAAEVSCYGGVARID